MTEEWIDSIAAYGRTVTVVRQEVPSYFLPGRVGISFAVSCTCGWRCNVASLEQDFALDRAQEHLDSHRELTADDVFDLL